MTTPLLFVEPVSFYEPAEFFAEARFLRVFLNLSFYNTAETAFAQTFEAHQPFLFVIRDADQSLLLRKRSFP